MTCDTHRNSYRKKSRMLPTAIATIALCQTAISDYSLAFADDQSFKDFPYLVHCELNGVQRAFYLSSIGTDGVAVYITPERQVGTITVNGKAERLGGEGSGSCAGKTLEQLRSSGQAYYLQQ